MDLRVPRHSGTQHLKHKIIHLKLFLFVLPCGGGDGLTSKQELERGNGTHLLAADSQPDLPKLEDSSHSIRLSHIQSDQQETLRNRATSRKFSKDTMGDLQHHLEEASKSKSSAEPYGFGLNSNRRLRATWQEA